MFVVCLWYVCGMFVTEGAVCLWHVCDRGCCMFVACL